MSDETPQKGWDSWFGADSSDDEQQAPQEAKPEARGVPALPAATPAPAPPTPTPPMVEPAATEWSVPTLGAIFEGGAPVAQETQSANPSPDAQRTQIAHHRADPDRTQLVPPGPDAQQTQFVPPGPDARQTQFVRPGPDAEATQFVAPGPDAQQTQFVPPKPDAEPTQAIAPQAMPTQALPARSGQGRRAPAGYARVPGQSGPPQENAVPELPAQPAPAPAPAPPQAPDAPPWQTPQPAQVWGAAAEAGYPQTQPPPPPPQQPSAWQQSPQGPEQQPPAGDEWDGWDDEPRRQPASSPATGAGNGTGGAGGGEGPGRGERGDETPAPRSRRKLAVLSGAGGVVVIGLVLALVFTQGGNTKSGAAAKPTPMGFQPTATTPGGAAEQTAEAFLTAWEHGDLTQAAQYTDNPTAALAMLTSYKTGLNLDGLVAAPQNATPATPAGTEAGSVPFDITAKVGLPSGSAASGSTATATAPAGPGSPAATTATGAGGGATAAPVTANWSYDSQLTAYQKNGGWYVKWSPDVVAPNLTADEKIVSVAVPPGASEVTDASGNDLSDATDVGVRNIAAALKKSAPAGQGTPGVQIELQNAAGTPIASSVYELSKPVSTGVVKTTIDPTVEQAAMSAVADHGDSAMVVLQPSTGDILAVANNAGDNDFALTARVAPGSTNKIVTSTALLSSGLVSSPSEGVECPEKLTIDGDVFENDQGEFTSPSTPFLDDFAESCNDAFAKWYSQIGDTTLAQTAEKYYGLNEEWNIGLGAAGPYYQIPSSASNGELAQELFGQGQLEAAPLAMASVAATVDTGDFKQPIVVPGQAQLTATPLPGNVQQDLQEMMKAVVYQSDGTAYGVFSGVNSTVYGKTGTADVSATQQNPNSWMVVYDPTLNVAIGCVVLDAGYGAAVAAPEAAKVLEALQ